MQKQDERITIRLSATQIEYIDSISEKSGLSRSDIIRTAIMNFEYQGVLYKNVIDKKKPEIEYYSEVEKKIPIRYLKSIDFLIELDHFESRSQAIQTSVRDMLYKRIPEMLDVMEKMKKIDESFTVNNSQFLKPGNIIDMEAIQ